MPLPANFHSTAEDVLKAYPQNLVTVTCDNKTGEFLGGHWALYPPSPADYFVRCLCGCAALHTVCNFEKHGGRGARKKWRESIKIQEGGSKKHLGTWIEERCNAADAGLPEEGSRVVVYWPGAKGEKWHRGQVKDIDECGRSTVAYDDDDREILYFAVERFKLEEGTPPPVLAIKHESSASLALGVIDLCSSSDELDDIEQPSLLSEDSLKRGAAIPARSVPSRQHTPLAQQVGTSASGAMLCPAPAGQSADPPLNQASQAAHTVGAPSHRHHQPSRQDAANVAHNKQLPGRVPWHGPRLPERPQKRKRAVIESGEAGLRQTQDPCSLRGATESSGKHRSSESVPPGATHAQGPYPRHTPNREQQQPTAPAKPCNIRAPLLASTPTQIAATTRIKLEPTSSQSLLPDLHDAQRAAGRQSPAAPQRNILGQDAAMPEGRQLVEADLPVRAETSAPMTELQQVLSLFDGDSAAGLAAKEAALTQLVMLVADSMTVARFAGHVDKLHGARESDRVDRYYQSICRLVQRSPGTEKVEDVLGMYFKSLCSGCT